jgi:hypothetical protein
MCMRRAVTEPEYVARLTAVCDQPFALALDVGGGMILEFRRAV